LIGNAERGATVKATAAVLYQPHEPLRVEEIDLEMPHAHEVLVKVVGSGVCGSDTHVLDGDLPIFGFPVVPGHEVAGIVEEVGPEVNMVTPGDHVLVNLMPGCGYCLACCLGQAGGCTNLRPGRLLDGTTRMRRDGQDIFQMINVGGFADRIVVGERGCVKIRQDAPLEKACLISCGVATGWSAVFYGAKVTPGSSAVVVGCGGVGLNVVQCLRLALAQTVIAVDVNPAKLDAAMEFGASHVVDASSTDPVDAVRDITGAGVDFGFEVISTGKTIRQAFESTRPGGKVTVVGLASLGDELTIPASVGRTVTNGGWGEISAWRDFPLLVDLYLEGKLKVDELVTRTRPLAEVNEAFDDLRSGRVARTVLLPNG